MTHHVPDRPRRADPDVPGVVGTALGTMPGTDVLESVTLLRGELGAPHISFLPALPARGKDVGAGITKHAWPGARRNGHLARVVDQMI